jgi:hypothetical protein
VPFPVYPVSILDPSAFQLKSLLFDFSPVMVAPSAVVAAAVPHLVSLIDCCVFSSIKIAESVAALMLAAAAAGLPC